MDYMKDLTYQEHKSMIKSGLNRIVEDFIEIGYHLKQVRDRQLFREDGYENINEFAKDEYGLSQSNTSRFISITECYSIDGNSPKLLPEFEGYGSSKLSEMLSLSPEEMKLVSIRTTVAEIRTFKEAKKEAEYTEYSDNYATSHNAETLENTQSNGILGEQEKEIIIGGKKLIIEFFRDKSRRNTLRQLSELLRNGTDKGNISEALLEIINPSGHLMFTKGVNILVFDEEIIKHSRFGAGGVREITYMDFLHDIALAFDMAAEDPWVAFYGEPDPEPEPESKPQSKTKPTSKPESKPSKVAENAAEPINDVEEEKDEEEEQLSGKAYIEDNPETISEEQEVEVVEADIVISDKKEENIQRLVYTVDIADGIYDLTALHEILNSIIEDKTECKVLKSKLESDDEINEIGE